jgi:antitoxin (DNA-binding transcriptional repressor) of toxin-antitoxin stability system
MKTAKIGELKDRLSAYLGHVKSGGTVVVLDRDRPIAHIVPVASGGDGRRDDGRLQRLERRGLIRRGSGKRPQWLGRRRRPRLRGSLLKDLLRERESGW